MWKVKIKTCFIGGVNSTLLPVKSVYWKISGAWNSINQNKCSINSFIVLNFNFAKASTSIENKLQWEHIDTNKFTIKSILITTVFSTKDLHISHLKLLSKRLINFVANIVSDVFSFRFTVSMVNCFKWKTIFFNAHMNLLYSSWNRVYIHIFYL